MAGAFPPSLEILVTHLMKLPTIGRRSAERLAFHLLKSPREQSVELSEAVVRMKDRLRRCSRCFNITEDDPCAICRDPSRDSKILCVVEDAPDALAVESAGGFRGRYHVLEGCLSPLKGVTAGDLHIAELDERVASEGVEELILAMNPSVDGEATALFVTQRYAPKGLRLSRIALGLPMGGSLEYADEQTLQHALSGRTPISGRES
ncbi:recombination protein RecR [Candidatus Sumerlaeota bacterium]|nr:recombination protein RecR [Candidatus Sumerlaeota bacterium]